jgi:hypothetical protein
MTYSYNPAAHFRLTTKQRQIMILICHGNGTDEEGKFSPIDIDELRERLVYEPSKQSLQFSIRALVTRKLITKDYEKRRGARRAVYHPTKLGKQSIGHIDKSFVASLDEEDFSYLELS